MSRQIYLSDHKTFLQMCDSLKKMVKHLKRFRDLKGMQCHGPVRWKTEVNLLRAYRA